MSTKSDSSSIRDLLEEHAKNHNELARELLDLEWSIRHQLRGQNRAKALRAWEQLAKTLFE